MKKEFTSATVDQFRKDFEEAIQGLEKKYGCNISLGTLRYDSNEVRGKMTAVKGKTLVNKNEEIEFKVGDKVKINHKKANPNLVFVITKINKKTIKVTSVGNTFNTWKVSPCFLELV